MSEVLEKSAYDIVNEMSEVDKRDIVESCLSNVNNLNDVLNNLNGLQDWFDVFVSSDKFANLPTDRRTKAVETFRDFYSFVDILNFKVNQEFNKSI